MARSIAQPHLERRGRRFYWRRRCPCPPPLGACEKKFSRSFLLFPLRTDVLREAITLAQRLTDLSDLAFAAIAERTMSIAPSEMENLLVGLCRFQIEAAELAREIAPARTLEVARYEQACAAAALDTLRQAILLRDREIARTPLRTVAARLGIALDEADEDWPRLAMRALRAMLEAGEENLRRDRGETTGAPRYLTAAFDAPHHVPAMSAAFAMPTGPLVSTAAPDGPPLIGVPSVAHWPQPPARPAEAAPEVVPVPQSGTAAPSDREAAAPTVDRTRAATRNGAACPAEGPTMAEIAEAYIKERCAGYRTFRRNETPNAKAGTSWAKNSAANVGSTARLLTALLPVDRLDEVTDEMLRDAWMVVERLPNNYGRSSKDKRHPRQVADDTDAQDIHNEAVVRRRLEKQGASPGKIEFEVNAARIPRLRAATIYRHMQDFQRICVFAVKKGHLDSNIMAEHIWDAATYDAREIHQLDNRREIWTSELLGKLFRTPVFQSPGTEPGDPLFWAPLIAVHSGLRCEEILQLALDDIRQVDGIWCFELSQGFGQSLKTGAARRTVPVHANLLELGLLDLIELRRREGEPRLFPWLERSKAKQTLTETFSKRFTEYRKKHNIYRKKLDFHSFRTTFNQALIRSECLDSQRRHMLGHAENDVGIVHYAPEGFAAPQLRNRIDAVGIDISMVRRPFGPAPAVIGNVASLDAFRKGAS